MLGGLLAGGGARAVSASAIVTMSVMAARAIVAKEDIKTFSVPSLSQEQLKAFNLPATGLCSRSSADECDARRSRRPLAWGFFLVLHLRSRQAEQTP